LYAAFLWYNTLRTGLTDGLNGNADDVTTVLDVPGISLGETLTNNQGCGQTWTWTPTSNTDDIVDAYNVTIIIADTIDAPVFS
jgi:hypothetical protein